MLYTIDTPDGSYSYRGIQPVAGTDLLRPDALVAFVPNEDALDVWLLGDPGAVTELRRYYLDRDDRAVGVVIGKILTERLWRPRPPAAEEAQPPPAGLPFMVVRDCCHGDKGRSCTAQEGHALGESVRVCQFLTFSREMAHRVAGNFIGYRSAVVEASEAEINRLAERSARGVREELTRPETINRRAF
jgi:hypothetical protein